MNDRKAAVLILACCAAALSAACAGGQGTNQRSGQAASPSSSSVQTEEVREPKLKVGVCIYRFDDEFMTLYRTELKRYLTDAYDADVFLMDGGGSEERQNGQIDSLIQQGCDVLILNLVQASEAGGVVDRCGAAGMPVVLINRSPGQEEIQRWSKEGIRASYVGADSRQSGTYQGEIILETRNRGDFNNDGTVSYVMIKGDPENMATADRSRYAVEALETGGMKAEKLFEESGWWQQDQGKALMEKALAECGDRIEVVFCNNDAMALGALEALEEANRTVGRDLWLVGVDALEDAVLAVKEGKMTGTVLNDHVGQSHMAADVAARMAGGSKVEREYYVDDVKISAEAGDLLGR